MKHPPPSNLPPIGDETTLDYVLLRDVPKREAEGWRIVSHLSHHGKYAVLMEKVE